MSLTKYDKLAEMLIARFGQSWMYDDKYKSILITNLIKSDNDYDPNKGSLSTYRFGAWNYAKLKMYQLKNRERNLVSLNQTTVAGPLYTAIASNEIEPLDDMVNIESNNAISNLVMSLLNDQNLTPVEKKYLNLIYKEGLTHNQIAEMCRVSKQAVSFTEQKALRKLRTIYVPSN